MQTENVALLKSGKPMPPEARVGTFDNNGGVSMGFTQSLNIPEGTTDEIKKQKEVNRRRLEAGLPPEKSKVEVFAVKAEGAEPDDDSEKTPVMDGWELISLDANGINFKLNFSSPLGVSSDGSPDLLLI